MNKVILIGNLGKDAELKVLGNGSCVANFSVATSEKWTDKTTKEKKEKTEWHNCALFGDRAKAIAQYLTKGTKVAVTGSIETRVVEKEGDKRYFTSIKVLDVEFLGGGTKSESSGSADEGDDDEGLPPVATPTDGSEIPF